MLLKQASVAEVSDYRGFGLSIMLMTDEPPQKGV